MAYAKETFAKGYSATILMFERILWTCAGFLVATVFLFGTNRPSVEAFFLNNSDLVALALGEQIMDPTFTGVSNTDDAFTIGASAAIPNGPQPNRVWLEDPTTSLELNSGTLVFARSDEGTFDIESRTVSLSGNAIITSSDGYRIDSQNILLDVRETGLTAAGGIRVQLPEGQVAAERLMVTSRDDENDRQRFVLNFEGGVKMTIFGSQEGQ